VPLLDTTLLDRLATGRKQESYFPIAVADERFHCIILKGGDTYPYFPRPLLSEFDFEVPLTSAADTELRLEQRRKEKEKKKAAAALANGGEAMALDEQLDNDDEDEDSDAREARKLHQQYLLATLSAAQLQDTIASSSSASSGGTYSQRATLSRLTLDADKALLQLLALECRLASASGAGDAAAADQRGMRALELVALMRDASGRMADAAGKVADRYGRALLGEKIRELAEKRVAEAEMEAEEDGFGDGEVL
jgi:chromosome transmission fidelity protein 4